MTPTGTTHPHPGPAGWAGRLRQRVAGPNRDRGAVTVEVLLYAPLLGLFLFTIIQAALWGAALVGARAAADGAARDAAAYGGTADDARASAQTRLQNIAGHLLGNPAITVTRDQTAATVTVSGSSGLIPLPVSWTSTQPVERFTVGG
jgi:Flp pilus assembly protein TadG